MRIENQLKDVLQDDRFEIFYRDDRHRKWQILISFSGVVFTAVWRDHTFMEEDLQELLNDINGHRYVHP
jgi:hypothetical protein